MDVNSSCERTLMDGLTINFNTSGWGPVSGEKIDTYDEMPYSHFDKNSKCNRIADFVTATSGPNAQMSAQQRYNERRRRGGDDGVTNEFAYKHDAEEDSQFQLVDTAKAAGARKLPGARKDGRGGANNNMMGGRGGRGAQNQPEKGDGFENKGVSGRMGRGGTSSSGAGGRGQGRGNQGGRGFVHRTRPDVRRMERLKSLAVEGDWVVVEEFDLSQMGKLSTAAPEEEDLDWCGHADAYEETYDKTSTRTAKPLKLVDNKIFYSVTTLDDPMMEKYATAEVGNVYATDAILSQLMAAPRSVYSWDIVVQRVNGVVFLDKRDDEESTFDLLTVSETASMPPVLLDDDVDPINLPEKLSLEATVINQNFSQQVLKDDPSTRKTFQPNPFFDEDEANEDDDEDDEEDEDNEEDEEEGADGEVARSRKKSKAKKEPASVLYRYRKFTLGNIKLVVRCELHGYINKPAAGSAVPGMPTPPSAATAVAAPPAAGPAGDAQYFTCFSLNEWDSRYSNGISWKQKLESQRGAVLATELKNNGCKMAKWTAMSIMAGADMMKLGYVSRNVPTVNHGHSVLAVQSIRPKELATQIALPTANIWGIVKSICELIMSQPEDGKYVLLKDPNKASIRLYKVPIKDDDDSDEDDESEEESEEEEETEDEEEDEEDDMEDA